MKLEFSRQILREILTYQISRKSAQWEPSCYTWTDGRTDMTKLIVALGNFANASKKSHVPSFGTANHVNPSHVHFPTLFTRARCSGLASRATRDHKTG